MRQPAHFKSFIASSRLMLSIASCTSLDGSFLVFGEVSEGLSWFWLSIMKKYIDPRQRIILTNIITSVNRLDPFRLFNFVDVFN